MLRSWLSQTRYVHLHAAQVHDTRACICVQKADADPLFAQDYGHAVLKLIQDSYCAGRLMQLRVINPLLARSHKRM